MARSDVHQDNGKNGKEAFEVSRPTTTLTLDVDQVRTLFAHFDLAVEAIKAFDAGTWKPRPTDLHPQALVGRVLKGASLELEMKALHAWLREQERIGGDKSTGKA